MTVDRPNLPKARTEKLIIKDLSDETLVYDLESDKAHCLNNTAAWVWKNCDGTVSVKDLSLALAKAMNCSPDESVIWFALDQLERFNLLEQPITPTENFTGMNRRQWEESLAWMTQKHNMPALEGKDRDLVLDYLERSYPPRAPAAPGGWRNPFAK